MKIKAILTCAMILFSVMAFAQKKNSEDPTLAVYKLLSNESINIKDSLAIYALNFELSISKKNKGTVVTSIRANDSLAFKLFPSYKKFSAIDFSALMGSKNKITLIIPILIHGSSPEKMIYKDKDGSPLISLNAAVNAAYALYRPYKYDNIKGSKVPLGHLLSSPSNDTKSQANVWEATIMNPINIVIHNIK